MQVIRDRLQGFAYSLVTAYCTGLYAGASISLTGNVSYTFLTRPRVPPGRNVSLSVFSHQNGKSKLERSLDFQPTSRPYYVVQNQQFKKGASQQQSSSDAWTGVFNYTIPWHPNASECGYAKSLPIPFCPGLCDGFCGAIASHVSLETMKQALQAHDLCMLENVFSHVSMFLGSNILVFFPTSLWGFCFLACIPPAVVRRRSPSSAVVRRRALSHTHHKTYLIIHKSCHIIHNSSHITHHSSHTQLISHNTSHTDNSQHHSSHTTHLTQQLISHTTHLTQLISYTTHLTQLISHTIHLTQLISHTTHLTNNSSQTQLILHTTHLTDRRSTHSLLKELRRGLAGAVHRAS